MTKILKKQRRELIEGVKKQYGYTDEQFPPKHYASNLEYHANNLAFHEDVYESEKLGRKVYLPTTNLESRRKAVKLLDEAADFRLEDKDIFFAIQDYSIAKGIIQQTPEMFDNSDERIAAYDRNIARLKKVQASRSKGLSGKIIATLLIVGGAIFLSPHITGNAIGSVNQGISNWIGGVSFLLGLGIAALTMRK